MLIPPVSRYMTPSPISVGPNDRLSTIRELMRSHRIHHLPVIEHQQLVGILSDRDVTLMNVFGDRVCDAMTRDVTSVAASSPIDEVATMMEAKRFGSVVVTGDDGVAGIFTVHDALRALRDILQRADESER